MRNWFLILAIGFGVFGNWVCTYEFNEAEFHSNTTEVLSFLEEYSTVVAASNPERKLQPKGVLAIGGKRQVMTTSM
ncbi:hypothetical protein L6452_36881 [Arctium lappa]|uniref:Uncharacterized protein n=1 Tax=Arctium lappa TaxID=4217 RepID=A0ACB8Y1Y6_ARCLA|nr:hypothetical protein L6452_36881 [Arctium lappa]